jgi:hypothetical protein
MMGQIKQMMQLARTMQSPQAAMQQIPQLQQAMDLVRQTGGDPEKAFYTLAKQKGVDPESILSQLR